MTFQQIKYCEVCGTSLKGRRADATVCSDTCRAMRNQRKVQQASQKQQNFVPAPPPLRNTPPPPPPIEVQAEEVYELPVVIRNNSDVSPLAQGIINELEENKKEMTAIENTIISYTKYIEQCTITKNDLMAKLKIEKLNHQRLVREVKEDVKQEQKNAGTLKGLFNDFLKTKKSYIPEFEIFKSSGLIVELQNGIVSINRDLACLRESREQLKQSLKVVYNKWKTLQTLKNKPLRRQDFLPQSKVPANIPRPQVVPIHQDEPTTPSTTPTPDAHTYTGKQVRNMALSPILHLPYDMNKYLGEIERDMCLIGLQGDAGAGKSTFAFFLAYLFDKIGLKVKYFSFEMGISNQVKINTQRFKLSDKFAITDVGNYADVELAASQFDVVVLDSFGKLFEGNTIGKVDDLRRHFPNTIFVGIFQKNAEGGTRGGSSSVYDSTAMWNIALKNKGLSNETRLFEVVKSRYGSKNFCLDDLLTKFV